MAVKVLTDTEYGILAHKALGRDAEISEVNQCKQVHRLLADGCAAEMLTPGEQIYASAFKDLILVKIPNDYGWEPGVEVEPESESDSETVKTAPPPSKSKKNGK